MEKGRIVVSAALFAMLAGCGDNRLRTSPYLKTASNDQACDSSIPGVASNTPEGGAGGRWAPGKESAETHGVPTASGTGQTGGGNGHGTDPGATTASPEKKR